MVILFYLKSYTSVAQSRHAFRTFSMYNENIGYKKPIEYFYNSRQYDIVSPMQNNIWKIRFEKFR